MDRPTWDHPLECGHTVRLAYPKASRRIKYFCAACAAMRRLGSGRPGYNPGSSGG